MNSWQGRDDFWKNKCKKFKKFHVEFIVFALIWRWLTVFISVIVKHNEKKFWFSGSEVNRIRHSPLINVLSLPTTCQIAVWFLVLIFLGLTLLMSFRGFEFLGEISTCNVYAFNPLLRKMELKGNIDLHNNDRLPTIEELKQKHKIGYTF